ncbi:MAG TPA: ABC transporter permease [Firmicutes bacterium]|jgi:simple sugar transport system permease protein|nr:ABC transporter permease [Bacillota bacterium]
MNKNALTALAGIGVALAAGLVILWAQGYPALPSYAALFSYSLFSKFAIVSTLNKATPLILTGLSAAVGFGSNCVNLGQVGQFLIGAMAVSAFGIVCDLPAPVMIPLSIMAALAAGALWAGIAAWLRQRFNMDEFITTLMLNFIADYFTLYLISGPMWDRATYSPMTKMTGSGSWLPMWDGLSAAFVVACIAFVVTWVMWDRSKLGYEWRAMGQNSVFSRVGGCDNEANFTRAMLMSGALAGLAGGLMIMGGMQHRFVKGMGANYAWDGVMIAIVAANGMLPTGLYALFFAAIQTGAMGMELETAVPSEFALVLQAIIVLFVVASRESTRLLINRAAANLRARAAARAVHGGSHGGSRSSGKEGGERSASGH